MMSYLRMYRDKFVESNDLEYIYMNQSLKFVDYMEQIGLGDKIVEIGSQQLKDSVSFYHGKSLIQTVNTMNNHLNAIKKFFVYLYKEGIADNIFNKIADYDAFRDEIITENNLKPSSNRGYIDADQIKELLDYFNSYPKKYSNMTMIGFFLKITLLVPAKRKVIANLKVKDFSDDFELLYHNGIKIKLPRALSQDIKRELEKISREICEENLFFELFCSCKYSENVFNTPFYYALRETGYDVPEDKDTFSVECIRNTGIVNLAVNGVNPYLIARLTGLSLGSLDVLLRRFEINIDEQSNIGEMINREISKFQFYQDI